MNDSSHKKRKNLANFPTFFSFSRNRSKPLLISRKLIYSTYYNVNFLNYMPNLWSMFIPYTNAQSNGRRRLHTHVQNEAPRVG